MNRLKIVIVAISVILCSCIPDDGVTSNDFTILSGIGAGNKLMLDGTAGVSSSFSFKSNYDWSIIEYKGFSCDPASGTKTIGNEAISVMATPLNSNNSGDTIRLSDLNFRLKNTRIVGISAHQLPQIIADKRKINIEATDGSTATVTFRTKCNIDDIELTVSNDNLSAAITERKISGTFTRYTITITAQRSNTSMDDVILGSIGFKVCGVVQERLTIDVIQSSAISFDRSCVILPGHSGGENMFSINSKYDVTIRYNSDKFSVTANGENEYIVKALVDNSSNELVLLGKVDVLLQDSDDSKITIEVYQQKAKASQTIMLYFIGRSLSNYFKTNIDNMLDALSANIQYDARIVATFTDASTDATVYELRYDSTYKKAVKEKVKEVSLSTPYQATTFEDVIRNMKEFAPAENYSLIIGSHGHGWPSKYFTETIMARLKSMGYTEPMQLWKKPEGAITRYIGDGVPPREYSTLYDIEEIATAIAANNIKLEYILFDACFMGNIESAYALRNSTKHIIGSPCEIMGAGFPYAKVTKYMLADNGKSYDLDKICKEFVDHYKTDGSVATRSACIAVTNTAELEALAAAVKKVNTAAVKDDFQIENVQFYDGLSNDNPVHLFYDLGDLIEQSCADNDALMEFKNQLKKSVTSLYHTDSFYSAYDSKLHPINSYSGTTTSAMIHFCSREWQKTEWYKATH